MKIEEFLSHLRNVKQINETQYCADCPCCNDTKRHLYIKSTNKNILLDCKKGCDWVDIVYSLGLQKKDLYYNDYKKEKWELLRTHTYTDQQGNKIAIKEIYRKPDGSKTAVWRRYQGNTLVKGLNGLKLSLYNVDRLHCSSLVFIAEGEKDVETLMRLGYLATTSPNGAGSHWRKDFNNYLNCKDIIVLSDNDNIGRKYALEVANSVSSVAKSVKLVDLRHFFNVLKEHQDITDIYDVCGRDRTIEILNTIINSDEFLYTPAQTTSEVVHSEVPEWYSQLKFDRQGNLLRRISNVEVILQHDENYKDMILFNQMSSRREYNNKNWTDKNESSLISYLEKEYDFSISVEKLAHALNNVEIEYHPVQDYLKNLEWDGISRIDTLFVDFFGCDDNIYTRTVARISLLGAVARVFNFGVKFDTCTCFVGKQGIGKSTFLRKLAIKDEWFTSDVKSFDNFYECIQGSWIIELGEGTAFQKSTKELTKQVIAECYDKYRTPYARYSELRPRQCVFFATTNSYDFLKDETGDRRFYPIDCKNKSKLSIFTDLTQEYVNQLWAEAYYRYSVLHESIYIDDINILKIAERIQREHLDENPLQSDIANYLDILLPELSEWYGMELSSRRRYIKAYLNNEDTFKVLGHAGIYRRDKVSIKEIMCEYFDYEVNQIIDRKISLNVARSLVALGWNKTNRSIRIRPYGKVKIYSL